MSNDSPQREAVGEVTLDGPIRSVLIERTAAQYEVRVDDQLAVLTFRTNASAISFLHTEVPETLRGQGLGEALARAALDDARRRGLVVRPYCPFVAWYIEKHDEYRPLIDPAFAG